ncbi:unnamed protein product [Peronospora farinosa]|uniref:Uncharacterized protein n=1 Tax=Peronospora farinosa TaxID=134698 RepID=A0ABN8CH90_9STRA|nr:unnamed protein product [Peronospora farinosa]
MGTTTDAHGHELTYHTLQSIERPEWPATPGMLRQNTASCYLYRRHKRTNKTEIFLWGSISNFGSDPQKPSISQLPIPGSMLFSVPEVAMQRNSVRSWTKPTATSGCPRGNVTTACHVRIAMRFYCTTCQTCLR